MFGAFIPNTDNKEQINHIDGNKENNNKNNLEWTTPKENIEKSGELGLTKKYYGEQAPRSRAVNQYDLEGNFIRKWNCILYVQNQLGIRQNNIISCCRGKQKTAGKYIWEYAD